MKVAGVAKFNVPTAVAGRVAKTGPASWCQGAAFRRSHHFGSSKLVWEWRLEPAVSRNAVIAALSHLVDRHESLRTTYAIGAAGDVIARVHEPDAPAVADVPADSEWVVRESRGRLASEPFDLTRQIPIRFGLHCHGSAVAMVVCVVDHVAADFWAMDIIERDFYALIEAVQRHDLSGIPEVRFTPLELGEYERSQVDLDPVRRHWCALLERIPRALLAHSEQITNDEPLSGLQLELRSRALMNAIPWLARNYSALAASVVLAGYVHVLATRTRSAECPVRVAVNNRFDGRLRELVAYVAYVPLVSVDVHDQPSFPTLLKRCQRATIQAARFGHCDPEMYDELKSAEAQRRGVILDRWFNFFATVGPPASHGLDSDDLSTADTEISTIGSLEGMFGFEQSCRVYSQDEQLVLELSTRNACCEEETMMDMARGIETFLVETARSLQ